MNFLHGRYANICCVIFCLYDYCFAATMRDDVHTKISALTSGLCQISHAHNDIPNVQFKFVALTR